MTSTSSNEPKQESVVWKRPDGFHGASPTDFRVVEVSGQARLWLHLRDVDNFPFRISGGWQEVEATKRLNNLVNMLGKPDQAWLDQIVRAYNNSMVDDPATFINEKLKWLGSIRHNLKGDTWEVEIMAKVLAELQNRIEALKRDFLQKVKN